MGLASVIALGLLVGLAPGARSSSTTKARPVTTPLVEAPLVTDDDVAAALASHYTKREVAIPMRDGARLHTAVWVPKRTAIDDERSWPILLVRTPYSVAPYGSENRPDGKNHRTLTRFAPSFDLIRAGYIFVHQDVRGRMMSEGTFVDVRPLADPARTRARDPAVIDESTDAWDTVDWLVKNVERNNGRVGLWGISYPGFYAAQAAVDAHPAVRAVAPMAPVTEWFLGDDFHHNGAFFLADALPFYASFGRVREKPTTKMRWDHFQAEIADVYDYFLDLGPLKNANARVLHDAVPFWNELLAHGTRDAWWVARDPRPRYRDIAPAVLVVGGWFDAEDLWGALHTYGAMQRQTPRDNRVSLVMGPWSHGGWHRTDGSAHGDVAFGQKTAERYRTEIETPFFEAHLRGDGVVSTPEAFVFFTGDNEWAALPAWPPPTKAQPVWLAPDGGLSSATQPTTTTATVQWTSDPAHPVPYLEGASADIDKRYMTADQRFASRRPDVVTFRTAMLVEPVTLAGPVDVDLWFSTTGTDADVVVKLIDVWPEDTADPEPNPRGIRLGGMQQLVRAEVLRGRFRDSFATPTPFVPGAPTRVRFTLPDVAHTFRAGHRLMVQVQSSWFPLVDRNPQSFVDIARADEADFVSRTHALHLGGTQASALRLPVLRGRLP